MVRRLLSALEYPQPESINPNDENTFRRVLVWLETNKIKKANPDTFNSLKNINSTDWSSAFHKYKEEVNCPPLQSHLEHLQWLLGLAVQLQTHNNRDTYIKHAVSNIKMTKAPNVVAENPLDELNFHSKEFSDGINSLATMLKIAPHPEPLIVLKAVGEVVSRKLSIQALENPSDIILKGTPFPFQDADLGFDLDDSALNLAAKVLRILYIHNLRDLQTKANELIVGVQNITANPKTDAKLGAVGKW